MQRLVYSPRAYVFIKDQSGTIHNVSDWVTAGNVTRKIDQVSSATVTLRNPEMKFTAHRIPGTNNIALPVFSPMDPITIYLRRRSGYPVRVFTGFLDRTPYLQLFPGTVTLQASCTLKRLLYTYFDPALPYTQSFLREYGWLEMENGVWGSFAALDQYKRDGVAPKADSIESKANGSISELLYATLKHIGHWNHDSIYIEKLPDDLYGRLTELAQEFQTDSELSKKAFENILKQIAGSGSHGGGGGASGDGVSGQTPAGGYSEITWAKEFLNRLGIPASNANMQAMIGWERQEGGHWNNSATYNPLNTSRIIHKGESSINGDGVKAYKSWEDGLQASIETIKLSLYTGIISALKGNSASAVGAAITSSKWGTLSAGAIAAAPSNLVSSGTVKAEVASPSASGNSGSDRSSGMRDSGVSNNANQPTTRSTTQSGSTKTTSTSSDKIYAPIAGSRTAITSPFLDYPHTPSHPHYHAGMDVGCDMGTACVAPCDGKISMVAGEETAFGGDGGMVHFKFTKNVGTIPAGTVIGWGHVKNIKVTQGQDVKGGKIVAYSNYAASPHVHFIIRKDDNAVDGDTSLDKTWVTNLYESLRKGDSNPTGDAGPGSSGDAGQTTSDSGNPDSGGAAALFSTLNLPGALDTIGANMLSGEKSLMNDKPLMPFVQQLCNAGLRHFQSMPDGKFYAFYPDYFGEFYQHPPYWEIEDIEIINGGVDLDDTALVTHAYVVGDTASPTIGATAPFWLRAVFSAGVVTIFNAFVAGDVLDRSATNSKAVEAKDPPKGMGISLGYAEANSFLERYGARPNTDQDEPLIKSNFYEMFLAYQRFMLGWSRQFLSQFTFTFMPEVFPGGKVGFPDHDLQLYVEEVSHSWDYTTGFLTQASLSAPSIYHSPGNNSGRGLLPPNMVKALIEPVSASRKREKDKPVTVPAPSLNSGSTPGTIRDSGPANNK